MGLFTTIRDFLEVNIRDLSEKALTPEQQLKLYIERAEHAVKDYAVQLNLQRAEENRLRDVKHRIDKEIVSCHTTAMLAVENDDLAIARKALEREEELNGQLGKLDDDVNIQTQTVTEMSDQLKALRSKLAEAKRERDKLIMRSRQVTAEQKIISAKTVLNNPHHHTASAANRMREEIAVKEAEISMHQDDDTPNFDQDIARYQKKAAAKDIDDRLTQMIQEKKNRTGKAVI